MTEARRENLVLGEEYGVELPKKIWMLWLQGPERMPPLIRTCIETWRAWHPDWEVNVLSEETLGDWTDPVLRSPKLDWLRRQAFADLARTDLLRRHGGVWADATCFCMRPLEDWLPSHLGSGFFAFANPTPERVVSSWFLASAANGYIVQRLWEELGHYYLEHPLSTHGWRGKLQRRIGLVINRNPRTTGLWFTPPIPQIGLTPRYGVWHYAFARLARRDQQFAHIWANTPKLSADGPHRLQRHGLDQPPSQEIIAEIEQRRQPMYKLNWRIDPEQSPNGTLNFLLQHPQALPAPRDRDS